MSSGVTDVGRSLLIVHADDFGETPEITRGILACIDEGVVTSTSILANMPGTGLALREAAHRGREASFGVHLNFCEGRPLTRARSLRGDDGSFHRKRALFLRAVAGRIRSADVEEEVEAQVATVRSGGVEVSHLDSHKHLHQLPGLRDVVLRVARKMGIERVRCTIEESVWPRGTRPLAGASRLIRRRMARRFRGALDAGGFRTTSRVLDLRDVIAAGGREARAALLRRPGTVSELFCHPGTELSDREKPGSCSRHDESRFVRADEFRQILRSAGADLVSWWDL